MRIHICVAKDEFLESKRIRFKFDVFALNLMLLYEKFDVFEMSLAGNTDYKVLLNQLQGS